MSYLDKRRERIMAMTAEECREEARRDRKSADESWDRSDTDGFLSQAASDACAREMEEWAKLKDNGGKAKFTGLYKGGVRVRAKIIDTKYGLAWAFCDKGGRFTGKFFGIGEKALAKKGYTVIMEDAPATIEWMKDGMMVYTRRVDCGYPEDAVED